MRDIVIPAKRIRKELITFSVCFMLSFLSNVWAIFNYKSPISELYSSFFYVLVFSFVIYTMWSVIRLIISAFIKIIHRKK